jgi:hypothetical protein
MGGGVPLKELEKQMATFEELMNQFRNPGETGIPDTFAEELERAHTEDLSVRDAAVSARETAAAELREQLAAERAEVLRVKAVNYDLMRAAPTPAGEPGENANNDAGDRPRGIAALFE